MIPCMLVQGEAFPLHEGAPSLPPFSQKEKLRKIHRPLKVTRYLVEKMGLGLGGGTGEQRGAGESKHQEKKGKVWFLVLCPSKGPVSRAVPSQEAHWRREGVYEEPPPPEAA